MLPDLSRGKWVTGKAALSGAMAGYFHIQTNVGNVKIAPFAFRTKYGRILFPVGKFEAFVTLAELQMVAGDSNIEYKILDSWQFVPEGKPRYPFRQFIREQYAKRLALKEKKDPLERAVKVILNSIYGKLAQRTNGVMGNLFCPAIAAFVTGYARARLYTFVRQHGLDNDVVAFATDSIATRKPVPDLDSVGLGEMKLDKHADDALYVSNGYYRFNGCWKQRGVGYDREKKVDIEHLDTIVSNDGQLHVLVQTTRNTHIRSGILRGKLENVGKIEVYRKKIGLNSDKKRFWLNDLTSLHEKRSCDSVPLHINLIADIVASESDIVWKSRTPYVPESDL
jgi:hypothetical protein